MPGASSPTTAEPVIPQTHPGALSRAPEAYLVLLRHGRTELNHRHVLQGASDHPLDDVGRQQAARAGEFLRRNWEIDKVVCSPRRRATETLRYAGFGGEALLEERLVEIDYGSYEGAPVAEVSDELFAAWSADPHYTPPGGESLAAVYERSVAACQELLAASPGRTVLVCAHANPLKAIVAHALDGDAGMILRMYLRQASVSVVASVPPTMVLMSFNSQTDEP